MKVACIGSNIESKIVLKGLVESGRKIEALITRPPGRFDNISDYVDLHRYCDDNDIICIDTLNVNADKFIEDIQSQQFDYLFTLGWSQLFKKRFIGCFSKMIVGSHPTPLPKRRGRAPIPWTILLEKENSAVTLFKIDTSADSGNIIKQKWFDIPNGCYAMDVYNVAANTMKKLYIEIYDEIEQGIDLKTFPQNDDEATYTGKRIPEDGFIDFSNKTKNIYNLIRAVSKPYPGAFAFYKGKKIIAWNAEIEEKQFAFGVVGQIIRKREQALLVQTGDGLIWLTKLTDEYDKEIDVGKIKINDRFNFFPPSELYEKRYT